MEKLEKGTTPGAKQKLGNKGGSTRKETVGKLEEQSITRTIIKSLKDKTDRGTHSVFLKDDQHLYRTPGLNKALFN